MAPGSWDTIIVGGGPAGMVPRDSLRPGREQLAACTTVRLGERGRTLLLATGVVDPVPPIESTEPLHVKSVHHCPYCDGWSGAYKLRVNVERAGAPPVRTTFAWSQDG